MNLCDYGCCPREVRDWFCGAGGAAMGLHRAWPHSHIVGYDIKPQKRYPFDFVQCDWSEAPLDGDFYWASPPCQKFTSASRINARMRGARYPDLVDASRRRLAGNVWAMENVMGAPFLYSIRLCGSSFGLNLWRHRQFETSHLLLGAPRCRHDLFPAPVLVAGTGGPQQRPNGDGVRRYPRTVVEARVAMGMTYGTRYELSQAVPPAYSEYIAVQLTGAVLHAANTSEKPDTVQGARL